MAPKKSQPPFSGSHGQRVESAEATAPTQLCSCNDSRNGDGDGDMVHSLTQPEGSRKNFQKRWLSPEDVLYLDIYIYIFFTSQLWY